MKLAYSAALSALLLSAAPAAARGYDIVLDTSKRSGLEAYFDLQFVRGDTDSDGARDPASVLHALLYHFDSDATLDGRPLVNGRFIVPQVRGAFFTNRSDFNAIRQRMTLGSEISLSIDLAGPGLDPGAFGRTFLSVSFYDADQFDAGIYAPILTDDPESGSLLFTIENGKVSILTPNNENGLPPIATAGAVPEPSSWAMMIGGFALAGRAIRTQRRSVRFARGEA